ncbi:hypothetical protein OROGR_027692 [Orobanche gracilis]
MKEISVDTLSASGRASEKLSLPALQSKMKCDPEGYETELTLIYSQFKSSLELFRQQAELNFTSVTGVGGDHTVVKDLGDRAMFLAHVTPFYPKHLSEFPKQLADLLRSSARKLPSSLRCHIVQALILLINKKIVDVGDTLALFMELQTLDDRTLKKLAFSHVIHSIRRMNQKHKNDAKNRALQKILFVMLQEEDETKAKRSLITLCDFYRRKVWFDDRTANAICAACFHTSPRIMVASLSFLLDCEKIEDDEDIDNSGSEDELATPQNHIVVSKEAIYKANHSGTTSSKKKKKAKLQRVIRSMKKQQRMSTENSNSSYLSPLNHLKDPQGFAEKLFSSLKSCSERFEVKMMMLKVIARTVGLHRLMLLNFYPYLQKYVEPHQRDVTSLLAAAVQSCHDMVPPDAVEPLFKQIVNQFVHDRSRTEAITVGLNVVREICLRIPLLMTEDLLQDLVSYKKSNEKSVSSAARSLLTLFREVCPSLLIKKDRGRPINPKARPRAFGEVEVASNVPGIELLDEDDSDDEASDQSDEDVGPTEKDADTIDAASDDDDFNDDDDDVSGDSAGEEDNTSLYLGTETEDDVADDDMPEDEEILPEDVGPTKKDADTIDAASDDDDFNEDDDDGDVSGDTAGEEDNTSLYIGTETEDADVDDEEILPEDEQASGKKDSNGKKRKFSDFGDQLNSANKSLRALKKLAVAKMGQPPALIDDGILSNEDFQRIKELEARKQARIALDRHGISRKISSGKSCNNLKIPSADQLSAKRVDAAALEANIKKKLTKEERVALIREGREDRGKYQARTAVKKKKTGSLSNKQKEHKKQMPIAAKRSKIAKSKLDKKRKQRSAGKQFRGRKAWK